MEKTTVCAKFILASENTAFNSGEITQTLGIQPTSIGKKGDKIRNGKLERRESFWEIATPFQESYDINEQLTQILHLVLPSEKVLKEITSQIGVIAKIILVIKIENNEKPVMHLNKKTIDFASAVGAEIDFDLYIYS